MTPSEAAPRGVLIVNPAFLGDAVFDAALARASKARWPHTPVGLVVRPPAQHLVPFMPYVDRAHVFDKRGQDRGLKGLRRIARQIRSENYDLALVPHPSLRSTCLAQLAGIPQRVGIGQSWLAGRPLTRRLGAVSGRGFVAARLAMLDAQEPTSLQGVLRCDPPARSSERCRLGVVLGSQWATKRWPLARAQAWAGQLDATRFELLLLGAPNEQPLIDAFKAGLEPDHSLHLIDGIGGGIAELVRQVASCDVLVGGDTGPLHIARALGVPTVALFGPTDPGLHSTEALDRVLTVALSCRPCSAHGHHRCPEVHHRCLTDLGGERVHGAVQDILSTRAP